ncbi:carboxypeptidase regulatory-like domain-containing protein [Candidatus Palauibacter sp.]|uniref:carboxypeptidase regulatory-like domain-containing protein n=1 Tax=Candidatus Palauibacter sp. TaxID=3101350 RepID=UPI003B024D03
MARGAMFTAWNPRSVTAAAVFVPAWLAFAGSAAGGQEEGSCRDGAELVVAVTDQSGSTPLPGATVVIEWGDSAAPPVRASTRADGSLLLCVPRDAEHATLRAEVGDNSSDEAAVLFEPGAPRRIELRIPFDVATGIPGRLIGSVRDALTDDPVHVVAVSLVGETTWVDTDRQGRFFMSGVPAGKHVLEARHLGYAPFRHVVAVERGHSTEVDIALVPAPLEMDPLVTTVLRSRRLEIKGFYERKRWGELLGLGTFITEDYIERWRPLEVAHVVSMLVPGVSADRSGRIINRRSSCPMVKYLDGMRVGSFKGWVKPHEVGGIEVYKGAASLPADFGGSASQCGVVAVWTK